MQVKKTLITGVFLLGFLFVKAQILVPKKDYVREIRQARYSFAFSLTTAPNSKLITFGIMRENPDSTHEVIFLTQEAFVRQIKGLESSRANPDGIDLFDANHIDSEILNELWKLKYDKKPYQRDEIIGWGTENGVPSKMQFEMLSELGVYRVDDYFYGDNFWRILKNMSNPVWKGKYLSRR